MEQFREYSGLAAYHSRYSVKYALGRMNFDFAIAILLMFSSVCYLALGMRLV